MLRWTFGVGAVALLFGCSSSSSTPDGGTGADTGVATDGALDADADAGAPDPLAALCGDIEGRLDATDAPGWAYAIIEDGEIVCMRAGGDACISDSSRAFTTSTPFRTQLVSELYTALTALELEAAGAIDLDATVKSVLPTFAIEPAAWADAITLRDLLHQASGLPTGVALGRGEGVDECDDPTGPTLDAFVADLSARPMGAPPGQFQVRDIASYRVLARALVENDPTHRRFADLVRERVFDPAGMDTAVVGWHDDLATTAACGHWARVATIDQMSPTARCEAQIVSFTSIDELARFAQVLANGGVLPSGERIFSESTIATVLEGGDVPGWVSADHRASIGLDLWPSEAGTIGGISYGGWGFQFAMAVVPARRFAVLGVVNLGNPPERWTASTEIIDAAFEARLGIAVPDARRPVPAWTPSTTELMELVGTYRSVTGQTAELALGDAGQLVGTITSGSMTLEGRLDPVYRDRFNTRPPAPDYARYPTRIYRDSAGAPQALWFWPSDHPLWRDPPGPPMP